MNQEKIIEKAIKHAFVGKPMNRLGIEIAIKKAIFLADKEMLEKIEKIGEKRLHFVHTNYKPACNGYLDMILEELKERGAGD